MKGLFKAKATACAALKPTSKAMASPGPWVAATASSCAAETAGLTQRGLRDGQKIFQVFARGQFGNDAAVFGMQLNLRRNGVCQDFSVTHNRGARLVAGGFNGKECHFSWSSSFNLSLMLK